MLPLISESHSLHICGVLHLKFYDTAQENNCIISTENFKWVSDPNLSSNSIVSLIPGFLWEFCI